MEGEQQKGGVTTERQFFVGKVSHCYPGTYKMAADGYGAGHGQPIATLDEAREKATALSKLRPGRTFIVFEARQIAAYVVEQPVNVTEIESEQLRERSEVEIVIPQ